MYMCIITHNLYMFPPGKKDDECCLDKPTENIEFLPETK